ncbi:hypothetical protein [Bifidobacterium anseris]|uniref:hypothetical protein n=1 Tax=Bifidobacterium anseris TaxID=2020963 RepID=UPI0013FE03C8|nr:hypothetical protein [Bifidobacterium anseris]
MSKDVINLDAAEEDSLNVTGDVGKAHGVVAQCLNPVADGLGESVCLSGATEEGEEFTHAAFEHTKTYFVQSKKPLGVEHAKLGIRPCFSIHFFYHTSTQAHKQ